MGIGSIYDKIQQYFGSKVRSYHELFVLGVVDIPRVEDPVRTINLTLNKNLSAIPSFPIVIR
jgi:hypothetical protein